MQHELVLLIRTPRDVQNTPPREPMRISNGPDAPRQCPLDPPALPCPPGSYQLLLDVGRERGKVVSRPDDGRGVSGLRRGASRPPRARHRRCIRRIAQCGE